MNRRMRFPCNETKAGQVLYLVYIRRYSQTQAALIVHLNIGTVCHVVHGRRFPNARPIPVQGY